MYVEIYIYIYICNYMYISLMWRFGNNSCPSPKTYTFSACSCDTSKGNSTWLDMCATSATTWNLSLHELPGRNNRGEKTRCFPEFSAFLCFFWWLLPTCDFKARPYVVKDLQKHWFFHMFWWFLPIWLISGIQSISIRCPKSPKTLCFSTFFLVFSHSNSESF